MTENLLLGMCLALALGIVTDIVKAKFGMVASIIMSVVFIGAMITAYAFGVFGTITVIISLMIYGATHQVTGLFKKPVTT